MLAGQEQINPKNQDRVAVFVERILPRIAFADGSITIDGKLPGLALRTPEVTAAVPFFAEQPRVRRLIVPVQQLFAKGKRIVAEGRDMSSVVFPNAQVKFFLTADKTVRARRRLMQYMKDNPKCGVTFEEVLAKNEERDGMDMTRADSPLVRVPDAKEIDTTHLTKDEVVNLMLDHCCANLKL
jgi:cytidylate kinase